MKVKLLVRPPYGPATQLELELPKDGFVLGRDLGPDPYLSRRHAILSFDAGGGLRIRDLESRNGTFVHGFRVRGEAAIDVGEFRLGRTRVCILSEVRPGQVSESILVRADYDQPKP